MLTLAMTAFNRLDYLQQVLPGLAAGVKAWPDPKRVEVSIEPSIAALEIYQAIKANLSGGMVTAHWKRMGPNANPKYVIQAAFDAGASLVVYAQDDVLVSPDWLAMCAWFKQHADDYFCFFGFNPQSMLEHGRATVSGTDQNGRPVSVDADFSGEPGAIWETQGELAFGDAAPFYSLGFAVGRKSWERYFLPFWDSSPRGCDWGLAQAWDTYPSLKALVPAISRNAHIGREGGTYYAPAVHDAIYHDKPWYQGEPPKDYFIVPLSVEVTP